jgi:hypothetical protein
MDFQPVLENKRVLVNTIFNFTQRREAAKQQRFLEYFAFAA